MNSSNAKSLNSAVSNGTIPEKISLRTSASDQISEPFEAQLYFKDSGADQLIFLNNEV